MLSSQFEPVQFLIQRFWARKLRITEKTDEVLGDNIFKDIPYFFQKS